jgi:predicted O-methyltransferase YrrM
MIRTWLENRRIQWDPKIHPDAAKSILDDEIRLFRSLPEYEDLKKFKRAKSMLHEDVLIILRYLARATRGAILELGPYVGGSTISTAVGLRWPRRFVSVDKGGAYDHRDFPSNDIIADLRKNLAEYGVYDKVHLIEGHTNKASTVRAVRTALGWHKIGLFIIDSDGQVERDFNIYAPLCKRGCVLVLDDYVSDEVEEKSALVKPYVDKMVAAGRFVPIGQYGWDNGTWIGRLA